MDQYASLFGEKNAALLLDCRSQKHEVIPVHLTDHSLLLVDTKVKHSLASSAYNERREACEEGVKIIRQKNNSVLSLRDVSRTLLYEHQDIIDNDIFTKCLYVVDEIQRTLQAAEFLKMGQLVQFGKLMYDTHWGLSQAYEVSCVELDYLVALAEEEKITGARMMGGGFGGCTINLVQNGKVQSFKEKVIRQYAANFNIQPEFYLVNLVDGVSLMNDKSEHRQP
jgi:galactokinase